MKTKSAHDIYAARKQRGRATWRGKRPPPSHTVLQLIRNSIEKQLRNKGWAWPT